ncbi:MAG: M24 family metallopeptidase, partial [Acidimicrobiia bacterium]
MIIRKSPEEIERMRRAGRLVGHTLSVVTAAAKPGVTLLDLDRLAERTIRAGDGIPSFLGYPGGVGIPFPGSLCLSPNDWVVHGIPNGYVLQEGDI